MPRNLELYLWEIERAITDIEAFTRGKTLREYEQDAMLRAAVERKFSVVGEALSQMTKHFPATTDKIVHTRKIVDFRNFLIHGYGQVDDVVVWGVVETMLEPLKAEVLAWKQELGLSEGGALAG